MVTSGLCGGCRDNISPLECWLPFLYSNVKFNYWKKNEQTTSNNLDAFARCEWIMINNKCIRKTIQAWIVFLNSTNCSQCLSLNGRVVALRFTQLSTPESYHSFIAITQLAEDLPNGFEWSICWDYEWICEMQISQYKWWCKFCFKIAKRCHILQSNWILGSLPQDAMQRFSNLCIAKDKRTIIIWESNVLFHLFTIAHSKVSSNCSHVITIRFNLFDGYHMAKVGNLLLGKMAFLGFQCLPLFRR